MSKARLAEEVRRLVSDRASERAVAMTELWSELRKLASERVNITDRRYAPHGFDRPDDEEHLVRIDAKAFALIEGYAKNHG